MGSETYYKTKTVEYFRNKGYVAEIIEHTRTVFHKGSKFPISIKKDILGADIIACNKKETILANSVKGKTNISKHKRTFEKYPSGGLRRIIVAWIPRQKEPILTEMPK